MPRHLLPAVLCAFIVASPSTAQDREAPAPIDLITTVNTVCVAAQGDRARAAALAVEAGFSPTPPDMIPFMRNSSETVGFMRSNETDIAFVMLGKLTRRVGNRQVMMDFCGVSSRPTDHRALNVRLRETMGFAPVRGAGFEAYAWLQTPEGRAPTRSLSDEQFIAMAETGRMRMVGVDRAGPGSTLIYFLPRLD